MNVEPTKQQNMRRVALTSLAGTSIEWYDFFLYGTAAAVILPKAFFFSRFVTTLSKMFDVFLNMF